MQIFVYTVANSKYLRFLIAILSSSAYFPYVIL